MWYLQCRVQSYARLSDALVALQPTHSLLYQRKKTEAGHLPLSCELRNMGKAFLMHVVSGPQPCTYQSYREGTDEARTTHDNPTENSQRNVSSMGPGSRIIQCNSKTHVLSAWTISMLNFAQARKPTMLCRGRSMGDEGYLRADFNLYAWHTTYDQYPKRIYPLWGTCGYDAICCSQMKFGLEVLASSITYCSSTF
jgi:hypothetical protein